MTAADLVELVAVADHDCGPTVGEAVRRGVAAWLDRHPTEDGPRVRARLAGPSVRPGAVLPQPPALPGPMDP